MLRIVTGISLLLLVCAAARKEFRQFPIFLALTLLAMGPVAALNGDMESFYTRIVLGFAIAVGHIAVNGSLPVEKRSDRRSVQLVLLFLVVAVAIFFRFYHLDALPPGIIDESAGNAMGMKDYVTGEKDVLKDHFTGSKPLGWNTNAAIILCVYWFKHFGMNPLTYRTVSAFAGVLAIVAIYLFGRILVGRRAALLASFFMAISPWHTFYCRNHWPHIALAILHSVLSYYVLWFAFKKRSFLLFGLLGFLAGVSVYLYATAKVVPVGIAIIGAVFLVSALLEKRSAWNTVRHVMLVIVAAGVLGATLVPYLRWVQNDSNYLYGSAGKQDVDKAFWENQETTPSAGEYMQANLKVLMPVLTHNSNAESPHAGAHTNLYGLKQQGVLNLAVFSLVVLGAAAMMWRCYRRREFILLIWLLVGLAPALLTAVMAKRLCITMAPIYLLAGLGAAIAVSSAGSVLPPMLRRSIGGPVIVALLAVLFSFQTRDHFRRMRYGGAPAYREHRLELWRGARETDMVTDLHNSIVGITMFQQGEFRSERSLHGGILGMLGEGVRSSRGISILANPRTPGNPGLIASLKGLVDDHVHIDTRHFLFLRLNRAGLDTFYGFSEPEPRVNEDGATDFVYRGTVVMPEDGAYMLIGDRSALRSVSIDDQGLILKPREGDAVAGRVYLTSGGHTLVIASSKAQPPSLTWEIVERGGHRVTAQPFVCSESASANELLRSIRTRSTESTWKYDRRIALEGKFKSPGGLSVDPEGGLCIMDRGTKEITGYSATGDREFAFTPQRRFTITRAVRVPSGSVFLLAPYSGTSVREYDSSGKHLADYRTPGRDLHVGRDGDLYVMRKDRIIQQGAPSAGAWRAKRSFTWEDPASVSPISMTLAVDDTLRVLLSDGFLYRLDSNLRVVSKIDVGAQVAPAKTRVDLSKIKVDAMGRLYVLDVVSRRIRILDADGRMLVSMTNPAGSLIPVRAPIDIDLRDGELYVLNRQGGLGVDVFRLPPE